MTQSEKLLCLTRQRIMQEDDTTSLSMGKAATIPLCIYGKQIFIYVHSKQLLILRLQTKLNATTPVNSTTINYATWQQLSKRIYSTTAAELNASTHQRINAASISSLRINLHVFCMYIALYRETNKRAHLRNLRGERAKYICI